MSGFRVLLIKEIREQVRTMRLPVLTLVLLIFGILSPILAKYAPDIVKAVAGDLLQLNLPPPSPPDAVDQFLKNIGQFGTLAAILLAMGSVAGEKERGTSGFVMTKPVSRAAFLAAKLVAISLDLLIATLVAGIAAYVYTWILFEALPVAGYAAMCLLLWLVLVTYAALTFLGSTLARSALAGAGIGVAALIVTGIVSALPKVGPYMPQGLLGPARALGLGIDPGQVWGPLAATLGLVAAVALLCWLVFRRQEL